jgi:hypothetical protein
MFELDGCAEHVIFVPAMGASDSGIVSCCCGWRSTAGVSFAWALRQGDRHLDDRRSANGAVILLPELVLEVELEVG